MYTDRHTHIHARANTHTVYHPLAHRYEQVKELSEVKECLYSNETDQWRKASNRPRSAVTHHAEKAYINLLTTSCYSDSAWGCHYL